MILKNLKRICAKLTTIFSIVLRCSRQAYSISDYHFIRLITFRFISLSFHQKKKGYSGPFTLFASQELCGKVLPMSTILKRNAAMNRLLKKLAPRAVFKLYVAPKNFMLQLLPWQIGTVTMRTRCSSIWLQYRHHG